MLVGRYLSDLLPALSVERVLATARTIEAARARRSGGEPLEAVMLDWLGFDAPGAWTTPFQLRAGLAAREAGIVAYDRLERHHLAAPERWRHPDLGARQAVTLGPERVSSPSWWPFMHDAPVADHQSVGREPRALPRALFLAQLGTGFWPGITAWEIMQVARLSLALAAFQDRFLGELGRLDEGAHELDRDQPRASDARRLRRLDNSAADGEVRLARLETDTARHLVAKGLEVLGYELYCFRSGVFAGALVEPSDPYLELGVAAEYAKAHTRRLASAAFARWRERCLVAGRDYATSVAEVEARFARALAALLDDGAGGAGGGTTTPERAPSPSAALEVPRGRRVLADVGWRLCHMGALRGDEARYGEAALERVARALVALDALGPGDDVDARLGDTLAAVAAELPDGDADAVLALGYAPLRASVGEPAALTSARARALVHRTYTYHPAIGAALDAAPALAARVVTRARVGPILAQLELAAEAEAREKRLTELGHAYFTWLSALPRYWDEGDAETVARRWHYRLAERAMPDDPATFARYEVAWNPYVQRLFMPFDPAWNDALVATPLGQARPLKPKQAHATWYAYVGVGRDGPLYLPLDTRLSALVMALRSPQRLDALVARPDFGVDFLRQAIASEAVLLFEKPAIKRPPRMVDHFDAVGSGLGVEHTPAPGPWNEVAQADAYEAFNARSAHYHESSKALVDLAELPPHGRIGELGFGSGVTTRLILERLGPDGRLVAVDPAPLLAERIVQRVRDARVRFEVGDAAALAWSAVYHGGFDRLVANASLWLAPDIGHALDLLGRAAAPGGRLAVSIPAQFMGFFEHMKSPVAQRVVAAIHDARRALGLGEPGEVTLDAALGSTGAMAKVLGEAGWREARFVLFERPWSVAEYLAWLSMPVVADRLVAPQDADSVPELMAAVAARLDPNEELGAPWYLVTAERPA